MEQKADIIGRYNRVILYSVAAFLVLSSFFVTGEHSTVLPISNALSMCLGILFDILLLISVYITSEAVVPRFQDRKIAVVLSATLIFACPGVCWISFIHPAAVALLWAQFCLLKEQYFTAFFLTAVSSLFFPPVLWIALLVIILMLASGLTDPLRNVIKFLGGLFVPYLLTYGTIFMFGGLELCEEFSLKLVQKMTAVFYDFFSTKIPTLFLLAALVFILVHAIILFSSKMKEYGTAEAYALKMQIINVVVTMVLISLFTSQFSLPVALLACCPAGILLTRYFSQYGSRHFLRIEIVILLCALVISRLGNLID